MRHYRSALDAHAASLPFNCGAEQPILDLAARAGSRLRGRGAPMRTVGLDRGVLVLESAGRCVVGRTLGAQCAGRGLEPPSCRPLHPATRCCCCGCCVDSRRVERARVGQNSTLAQSWPHRAGQHRSPPCQRRLQPGSRALTAGAIPAHDGRALAKLVGAAPLHVHVGDRHLVDCAAKSKRCRL